MYKVHKVTDLYKFLYKSDFDRRTIYIYPQGRPNYRKYAQVNIQFDYIYGQGFDQACHPFFQCHRTQQQITKAAESNLITINRVIMCF